MSPFAPFSGLPRSKRGVLLGDPDQSWWTSGVLGRYASYVSDRPDRHGSSIRLSNDHDKIPGKEHFRTLHLS